MTPAYRISQSTVSDPTVRSQACRCRRRYASLELIVAPLRLSMFHKLSLIVFFFYRRTSLGVIVAVALYLIFLIPLGR